MVTLTQIKHEQLQARKAKDSIKATLLTTFLGEIQGKFTAFPVDKRTEQKEAEVIQACLTSFLKQNRETQALIKDTDKLWILQQEEAILKVFEPDRMSEDELKQIIQTNFSEINAKSKGPIMGFLKKEYGNSVDASMAMKIIESLMV